MGSILRSVSPDKETTYFHVRGEVEAGQVLNQIAAYMLNETKDICPNWLLEVPAPTVSIGKKCNPFKIEMVVRGNLTGHAWRTYSSGKRTL